MSSLASSASSTADQVGRARAFLAENGWLSRVAPDFRSALLSRSLIRSAQPGDRVASAGDEIGGLFGLAEGCLAQNSPMRIEAAFVHLMHPGDWSGHVPIITGEARILSTEARTPCVYALVPLAEIQRILAQLPHGWRELGRLAVESTRISLSAATEFMLPDSERRAAGALIRLAGYMPEIRPTVQVADIPASQDELAVLVGVSRNTLAKILAGFEERGLVEMTYRRIHLPDPEALRLIARDL